MYTLSTLVHISMIFLCDLDNPVAKLSSFMSAKCAGYMVYFYSKLGAVLFYCIRYRGLECLQLVFVRFL